MSPFDFARKTVLVTGASMGIGAEFARQLSRQGATLVLVARGRAKLAALAQELGRAHVFTADLGKPGAAKALYDEVAAAGLEVDVLVNNAGFGLHGPFASFGLEAQREMIDVNAAALYELTYLFMPTIERRKGGVLNVCSVAGHGPIPFMAVYGATKAFVLSFSQALWAEYGMRGVRVTCLSPGATDTAFFARSGPGADPGKKAQPSEVAKLGLSAFVAGRSAVVHGAQNRMLVSLFRFLPRELTLRRFATMAASRAVLASGAER